jgi:hypothetical protein
VSVIVFAFPLAGSTEWLAWVAARDDIDRLNLRPVHGGYVPKVWHAGVMGGQHFARSRLHLGVPGQVAAHGHV